MREVKINFADFWKGFEPRDNYFWDLLSERFELEISEKPDFIIYGPFGKKHLTFNCIKIFYTGENVRPDFNICDFAFSFEYINNERHFRLPLFALNKSLAELMNRPPALNILKQNRKFCNFVYSNINAKERIEFFQALSKFKTIDSGGKVLNNLGYRVNDLLSFIGEYKFTISFENTSYPGYTTEKIIQPMRVNSIPIYWGNPLIHLDFNEESFVNIHRFSSFEEAVKKIIEIDSNEDLYNKMLSAPYFTNNKVPHCFDRNRILDRFEYIFSCKDKIIPVSQTLSSRLSRAVLSSAKLARKIMLRSK